MLADFPCCPSAFLGRKCFHPCACCCARVVIVCLAQMIGVLHFSYRLSGSRCSFVFINPNLIILEILRKSLCNLCLCFFSETFWQFVSFPVVATICLFQTTGKRWETMSDTWIYFLYVPWTHFNMYFHICYFNSLHRDSHHLWQWQ